MRTELKKYITKQVKRIYPNQKNGDCYKINSSVGYFLGDLNYEFKIIQGRVALNKRIYDPILEENQPYTKGITIYPDHIWVKLSKEKEICDFAKQVFLPAKIMRYGGAVDSLWGQANKKLYKLLLSNKRIVKKFKKGV
jgi:hypothetical protein